jgi:hypothetical protein
MRKIAVILGILGIAFAAAFSPAVAAKNANPYPLDGVLRLQDVQMLGTHNSYHVRPTDRQVAPTEPANYEHPALDVQLASQGIRSLEIDVFNQPGMPVFHSILVDQFSNCPDLNTCFRTVAKWSKANPGHLPISIFLEPKPIPVGTSPIAQQVIDKYVADHGLKSWDAASIGQIDATAKRVFGKTLLKPDDVRGKRSTLRAAILRDGWPTLGQLRGKVFVVLNATKPLLAAYATGAPSLQKKSMFMVSTGTEPYAAVISRDKPVAADIQALVKKHFLVRTLADADGVEARANDLTRAATAFASGATVVGTDYPVPDPIVNAAFVVDLPGTAVARCNPVTAPKKCTDLALENAKGLKKRP